jgi:hypothetical protein
MKVVGATATTTAVAGLGATPVAAEEPPRVPEEFPTISAYDHYSALDGEGDVALANDETPAGYDVEGDWSGFDDPDEIQLFVHGFVSDNPPAWARYEADVVANSLEKYGYDAFNVAFNWQSDVGWLDANTIAERSAVKLAEWVRDVRANDDRPVRIVAHSLGARVVGALLEVFAPGTVAGPDATPDRFGEPPDDEPVASVALMGAAIGSAEPQLNATYGNAIGYSTDTLYNYYSTNDPVLKGSYAGYDSYYAAESVQSDSFLGYDGIADPERAPDNYVRRNVSDAISGHSDYRKPDVGIMDTVAEDFTSAAED